MIYSSAKMGSATSVNCTFSYLWLAIAIFAHQDACGQSTMSQIKGDEVVVFFPAVAHPSEDSTLWTVPIHGWIFEPEEDDLLRAAILRELRDELGQLEDLGRIAILEKRLRLFLVDNERGKQVGIRIAGSEHTLPASAPDGHFFGTIQFPAAAVQAHLDEGRLPFRAILRDGDSRDFSGVAYCLPPTGVSVISDVDDTIKVTNVRNRKELLANTFVREFRPVDGMAAAYRRWAEAGAQFHYVSASPWQLFQPLVEFTRAAGFPDGVFHLKRVRLKDSSLFDLFADPFALKLAVIERLIQDFPQRRFILVGDSGEKDPEVYAELARRFRGQILRVYIRDVTDEAAEAPRYRAAFRDVPPDQWQLFQDPAALEWPVETPTQ